MVMCISALLEGNEVCLFLKLIYPPHIPLVRIFNKLSQNSRGRLENSVLCITDPASARDSISQHPAMGPSFLLFIHLFQKHFSVFSAAESEVSEVLGMRQTLLFSWSLHSSEGEQ